MHRRSKILLTLVGAIVVGLSLLYAVALTRSTLKLRRAYAALEADGRPMNPSQVLAPEIPDAQNAAVLYQSAALMLKGQPAGEKNLLEHLASLHRSLFDEPTKPDKIARQQRQVAELQELMELEVVATALAAVAQGTQRPACQFDRDVAGSLARDMPFLDDLRCLRNILGARAALDLQAGHADQAWDTVLIQLRFADALRQDPLCVSQWTRMSVINYTCGLIQRFCDTAPPDMERSQAIEGLLRELDDLAPFVRGMDGERLLVGEWFFSLPWEEMEKILRENTVDKNKIVPERIQKVLYALHMRSLEFKPRLLADHAAYLEWMRKSTRLLQGPYVPRSDPAYQELGNLGRHFLANKLTLTTGLLKRFHCDMCTSVRLTRAGLGLLRYKQAHGAFPPTLDALRLEGLIDPFNDKPLLYRAEGDGFVVYSVGDDQNDNGGVVKTVEDYLDTRKRRAQYDRAWHFPRPKSQPEAAGG